MSSFLHFSLSQQENQTDKSGMLRQGEKPVRKAFWISERHIQNLFQISERTFSDINPVTTTSLLTLFLIGPYHELFTCVANYDKLSKLLHTQTCT